MNDVLILAPVKYCKHAVIVGASIHNVVSHDLFPVVASLTY